ncbi:MAG: carboxypeptidase regulatory-like domain-containing protein [Bryobacteraceae bacterium]
MNLTALLRVSALTMILAVCAFAQRDLATLVGTVTDPTGAGIPNAKVSISEEATGLKYELVTAGGGEFARPALKPGVYMIAVEAAGFKTSTRRNIILTAGDRTGVDFPMQVGEVSTNIEVTAEGAVLQTESTIIGASVDAKQVSELPLGGTRNFAFLARLSPGVVPNEPGARDATGGGFSANGVRSNGQNNFLLNGVDNNVNVIDFLNQTSFVIGPSVEAIGEMRVMTNGYNAEYGRGAGGVVNVTIKSGTNQVHGSLFEYLQNDKMNANRWENNRNGLKKGPFKQNQFGAAVGGPLIKNRTFWFADYQGTEIRSTGGAVPGLGTSAFFSIPTAGMKNGDFSHLLGTNRAITNSLGVATREGQIYDPATTMMGTYPNGTTGLIRQPFAGNLIPASRIDPAAKKIADLFPAPNVAVGAGIALNNYFTTTSGTATVKQFDVRMDHRLSDNDNIFGSVSWSERNQVNGQPLPGALDATYFASNLEETLARNAMLSYTRTWNPSVVSETRVAFSRLVTSRTQALPDVDQFKAFGIGGYNPTGPLNGGLPSTNIDRYSGFGASDWLPSKEYNNVWDFIQNVAIQKNTHSIKFGGEFRPIKFPFFQFPSPHGNWTFNRTETSFPNGTDALSNLTGDGYASFLLGRVSQGQLSTTNFISSQKEAWAFYAQDDWKVNNKLTVNFGVRYELFSPIGEKFGRQANFDFDKLTLFIPKGKDQDAPLPPNFSRDFANVKVSRGEVDQYLIPWDKTSIAPRIGFAYQAMANTVVRVGYGIFYGGEENQGGNPNRGEGVPFNQTTTLVRPSTVGTFEANPFFNPNAGVSGGFPANIFSLNAPINFRSVAQNFRNPLVHKWNFSIQREFRGGNAFELAYVGNHQAHQLHFSDPNAPFNDPRPNIEANVRRPIPNLGGVNYTSTFGFGNYAGLTAKWEKRYSAGLQYLVAYTWGHALATSGTTLSGSAGFGPKDPRNYSDAYSSAAWDVRHSMTASFLYDVPIGKGKALAIENGFGNALLGNWQVNGILTLRTGNPYTLGTNQCVGSFGNCTPDLVSGQNPNDAPSSGRTVDQWFNTAAVTRPAAGTPGNLGLQSNNLPGQAYMDFSLFKAINLTERFKMQFRAEAFNLTNTPQFGAPNRTQGDPNFGRIFDTQAGTQRRTQFALRFMF